MHWKLLAIAITYPTHSIVARTDLSIQRNRRNGRKQAVHLERARAVQKIDYPNNEWAGRKQKKILSWNGAKIIQMDEKLNVLEIPN